MAHCGILNSVSIVTRHLKNKLKKGKDAMFCRNCGTQLDDKAETCLKCGATTGVASEQANQRQISFGEAVQRFFTKKNFSTDGRASRSEYWYTILFLFIVDIACLVLFGDVAGDKVAGLTNLLSIFIGVRRLHDSGKSGWFILVPIYNIVLLCQPSENATNKYGIVPNLVG